MSLPSITQIIKNCNLENRMLSFKKMESGKEEEKVSYTKLVL